MSEHVDRGLDSIEHESRSCHRASHATLFPQRRVSSSKGLMSRSPLRPLQSPLPLWCLLSLDWPPVVAQSLGHHTV
jgi:hypothetical protein